MRSKKKLSAGAVVIILLLCLAEYFIGLNNNIDTEDEKENYTFSEKLEVHYIDINQGDCTLIKLGDKAMLIDAGNNGYGTMVKQYLKKQGVKKLDYVIGTHPDADHIGGLDVAIYNFDCGTIIMPDYSKDTKTYDDVIQTVKNKNYKITEPTAGKVYEFGEAKFTILSPLHYDYGDNANNYSVSILLEYGNNRFLFTGDCEEEAEMDMLEQYPDLHADVFKAAHHGSNTANSYEFLEAVSPEYIVISCGEGNTYGHPHAEILNNARAMGIKIFRTDEQGTIVATSDGNKITFNMSPSTSWKSGR